MSIIARIVSRKRRGSSRVKVPYENSRALFASRNGKRGISKHEPLDLDGFYILLDEFGTLGRPIDGDTRFGFVASVTGDIEGFERCGQGYIRNPDGSVRKARDRKNTYADRKTVLIRILNAGTIVRDVVIDKLDDGSIGGKETYLRLANNVIESVLGIIPEDVDIYIIADHHSAWGDERDIRGKIRSDDHRIRIAIQEKSSQCEAVATNDYVAYAAGAYYNKKRPGLWKYLNRSKMDATGPDSSSLKTRDPD